MSVSAMSVKSWVEEELPPMSWSVIQMKLIKILIKNGIRATAMDESTEFNEEIMDALKEVV